MKMVGFVLGRDGFGSFAVVNIFKGAISKSIQGISIETSAIQVLSTCDDEGCSAVYDTTFADTRRAFNFLTVQFRVVSDQTQQVLQQMSKDSFLDNFANNMRSSGYNIFADWTEEPRMLNEGSSPDQSVNVVLLAVLVPLVSLLLGAAAIVHFRRRFSMRQEEMFKTPFAFSAKESRIKKRRKQYDNDQIMSEVGFPPQHFTWTGDDLVKQYPVEKVEMVAPPSPILSEQDLWNQRAATLAGVDRKHASDFPLSPASPAGAMSTAQFSKYAGGASLFKRSKSLDVLFPNRPSGLDYLKGISVVCWHICEGCGQPIKDGWPRCPACHTPSPQKERRVSAARSGSSRSAGNSPINLSPRISASFGSPSSFASIFSKVSPRASRKGSPRLPRSRQGSTRSESPVSLTSSLTSSSLARPLPQYYPPAPPPAQEVASEVASVMSSAGPSRSPSPAIRLRDFLVSKAVSRAASASARASPEGTPRSGTPPVLTAELVVQVGSMCPVSSWHMCLGCGQPIKDGWPRCPSCHTTPARQVSAALQGPSADTVYRASARASPGGLNPPALDSEIAVSPDPVWIHIQSGSGNE